MIIYIQGVQKVVESVGGHETTPERPPSNRPTPSLESEYEFDPLTAPDGERDLSPLPLPADEPMDDDPLVPPLSPLEQTADPLDFPGSPEVHPLQDPPSPVPDNNSDIGHPLQEPFHPVPDDD